MDKCTRPVGFKNGKYILCGGKAKYTVGMWDVCEGCKPEADEYTRKYAPKGAFDENES